MDSRCESSTVRVLQQRPIDPATGVWTYTLSQSLADSLAEGDSAEETFAVTVSDGVNSVTTDVTITITGTNDAPVIAVATGAGIDSGAVTEAGVAASVSGSLTASDVDDDAVLQWSVDGTSPYGEMVIDPDTGEWTFTLGAAAEALTEGQEVQASFTATVTDEHGATDTRTITIDITGSNDGPVVTTAPGGNAGQVEESGERSTVNGGAVAGSFTASGLLAATDADAGETATLSWATTDTASYGTFTLGTDGSWTYVLDPSLVDDLAEGDSITDTFTAVVTDAQGATSTETVTVTILGTNDAPVINTETTVATGSVTEAATGLTPPAVPTTTSGQLVATDVDSGDALTWSIVGTGAGTFGALSLVGDTWTYTLDDADADTQALTTGTSGTDSFTVRVTDSQGVSRDQTVTITIDGRNEVFTGTLGDDAMTGTGTADSLSGLAGDDTISGGSGNDVIYGGDGDDSMVGGSGDDLMQGGAGSDIAEGLSGNDTLALDGDWDDYVISLSGLTYSFQNTVSGDLDRATSVEFVSFNGGPAVAVADVLNDAPVAGADSGFTVAEDGSLSIPLATLLANDTDADILAGNPLGETLSISAVSGAVGGSVAIVGGNVVFTPTPDFHGPASFTYTLTDIHGATATGSVSLTVTPVNDAPVVADATASGSEDAAITGSVAGTDVDGDDLTYALVAPVDGLSFNPDGSWSYDPAAHQGLDDGETAEVSFSYTANDGTTASAPATVTITVTGVNDAPVVADATASGSEDAAITGSVAGTDVDGDDLTYALVAPVAGLSFNPDGSWSYDPAAHQGLDDGETAEVSFSYTAHDGTTASAPATVTITVTGVNDAPVGTASATLTDGMEDQAYTVSEVDLLAGFADADGDELTVVNLTASNGTAAQNPDGSWTITPAAGFTGTMTLTYEVSDGDATTPASLGYTVLEGNEPPADLALSATMVSENATASTVVGTLSASDPDVGDVLTFTLVDDADGRFAILGDQIVVADPAGLDFEAAGSHEITVRVTDAEGAFVEQTFTITVSDVQGENLVGTAGNDTLNGGIGNDTLMGSAGGDVLAGGADFDIASYADATGPVVVSLADASSNTGDAAGDSYVGIEALHGSAFDDSLTGDGDGNLLAGNAGNDSLDGLAGADTLQGGAGNDTYVVDDAGDVVDEATGPGATDAGGVDTVLSSVTMSLAATAGVQFVERLTLTGTANIDATGNALANVLTGNAGNNVLDGGAGIDTMFGGAGNDTYIVDNVNDRVFETTTASSGIDAGGIDTIISSVYVNLDANAGVRFVERLTMTGTANLTGVGNALNNVLTGNAGNNALNGGLGVDTMFGGAGNDTYIVDNVNDRVFETTTASSGIDTGGIDTIISSVYVNLDANAGVRFVERLTLTGTANLTGIGNALDNVLTGNSGNNSLNAGLGNDTMTGGAGSDNFVFSSALGVNNIDHITDFSTVDDLMRLDDAVFAGLSTGTLLATAFEANLTGQASDALDRVIYETDTGKLFFDADGNGAGARVQFATLTAGLALTNADFFVF